MPKCSIRDCTEPAIGGFQEFIDAGSFSAPHAIIPDRPTVWCAEHERMLRSSISGKRGRFLIKEQLKD